MWMIKVVLNNAGAMGTFSHKNYPEDGEYQAAIYGLKQ